MSYGYFFHKFVPELQKACVGCETFLDIGCGKNSPLQFIPKKHSEGVDLFQASINESMSKNIHDKYHKLDVLSVGTRFRKRSFDCVVALDLIEHLEKNDGLKLLKIMETIARKKVIIYTPNGFVPQKGIDNNIYQEHKSGWTTGEMKSFGYSVKGINGWKKLRGDRATMKFRPTYFWIGISDITELYTFNHPESAYHLLCTKEIM